MTLSADIGRARWLAHLRGEMLAELNNLAVIVEKHSEKRAYLAVACETLHKKKVLLAVKNSVTELFAGPVKREFFEKHLKLPSLSPASHALLLEALTEFDGDSDRALIATTFAAENGLCLDGVYNFCFGEVKARWQDIGGLTNDNAVYLADSEVFFELIKFLYSAITPKVEEVSLSFDGEKYVLGDRNGKILRETFSEDELFCMLIRLAPVRLEFVPGELNNSVQRKLGAIFSIKPQKMTKSIF